MPKEQGINVRADVLLVTATKVETKAVLDTFGVGGRQASPKSIDGRVYFDLGTMAGARVMMTQSEMGASGLGAAQQAVEKGIAALLPSAVIMVGIAFGVSEEKQKIGDVLISERLRPYELQRVGTGDGGSMKILLRDDKPHASPWLLNLARSSEVAWEGAELRFGTLLSGAKLVDNLDFREQLRSFEPEAIGGEMEGSGLYVACHDRKIDWIIVKGICDFADGQKSKSKTKRQALAAKNAAAFVHHALQFAKVDWDAHRHPIRGAIHPTDLREIKSDANNVEQLGSKSLKGGIIHPLPPAPAFVGREQEIAALVQYWRSASSGVLALVGLGGAGKTAIAERLVEYVEHEEKFRADGMFIWSFYTDQNANTFLRELYRYFTGGQETDAMGGGVLHQLTEILSSGGHYLIVMDGLERIQRTESNREGLYGQIDDPLIRLIVSRIARGMGNTVSLITTRFPVVDLEPWQGRGYRSINVDQLETRDALALLRRHQIRGEDANLIRLIEEFGAHALTLDYLAKYLFEFCAGDPSRAYQLPQPDIRSVERTERKLARVLVAYEQALNEHELALLQRLCVFRMGTTADTLFKVFILGAAASPRTNMDNRQLLPLSKADVHRIMRRLINLHLVVREGDDYLTVHPSVRDHFYRLFVEPARFHGLVREYYSALATRPGVQLPTDRGALDLLEEVIHQALEAGELKEAMTIYWSRLGGYQHLAWNLGDYLRCHRILRMMRQRAAEVVVDPAGEFWSARALGDTELRFSDRASMVILRGELPKLGLDPVGLFLRGIVSDSSVRSVPDCGDLPILREQLLLYEGRTAEALQINETRRKHWNADEHDIISRCDLVLADILRLQQNFKMSREKIEQASEWVLHSGSQEHLCLFYLLNARVAIDEMNFELARRSIKEGIHISERCQFTLFHIELSIEQARLFKEMKMPPQSERAALAALNGILRENHEYSPVSDRSRRDLAVMGARHPECQFVWGELEASRRLGLALIDQGKHRDGSRWLRHAEGLRTSLMNPGPRGRVG